MNYKELRERYSEKALKQCFSSPMRVGHLLIEAFKLDVSREGLRYWYEVDSRIPNKEQALSVDEEYKILSEIGGYLEKKYIR